MTMSAPVSAESSRDPHELTCAKLELLEFLVGADDLAACATRGAEWLVEHAGATDVLCAVVDPSHQRLGGVAGHGQLAGGVARLEVELEERAHPLVQALHSNRPTILEGAVLRRALRLPRAGACLAIALRGPERVREDDLACRLTGGTPVGLLLAGPVSPRLSTRTRWLARKLGQQLARLHVTRQLSEAERRLRRERAQLDSIINAVPDPILLTDADGRRVLANAPAEAMFVADEAANEGRRRAIALNNVLFEAARPSRAGWVETARRELFLVDPSDGTDLLFELLSAPAAGTHGRGAVVSVLRNVTDLRRATDELETNYRRLQLIEAESRAERDRLDLVIDSVTDPILVTDPDGHLVLMNRPAERLFTITDDLKSEAARHAVRTNDQNFEAFMASLMRSERETRLLGALSLADPDTLEPIPVQADAGKLLSHAGELTGMVTILHDRTEALEKARLYAELKKASDELEEKVRDATAELLRQNELLQRQHLALEQASALKTQFLANMSHEFRTPLNAILGYTAMMLQGVSGDLSPLLRRNLSRVDSNARHLLTIINDILDISRIESGKMPLTLSEFPLPELVAELTSEVEPLIAKTRLSVTTELEPNLPAVRCDRQKLKQVLLNLLTNALKFTPAGGVRVRVRPDPATDTVSIGVVDTGIGIAQADHERIFEDFRQADNSTTREYGGTGLGLAIVRRLVEMLDGRVTLESAPGEGSTFTVTIPRRLRRR